MREEISIDYASGAKMIKGLDKLIPFRLSAKNEIKALGNICRGKQAESRYGQSEKRNRSNDHP